METIFVATDVIETAIGVVVAALVVAWALLWLGRKGLEVVEGEVKVGLWGVMTLLLPWRNLGCLGVRLASGVYVDVYRVGIVPMPWLAAGARGVGLGMFVKMPGVGMVRYRVVRRGWVWGRRLRLVMIGLEYDDCPEGFRRWARRTYWRPGLEARVRGGGGGERRVELVSYPWVDGADDEDLRINARMVPGEPATLKEMRVRELVPMKEIGVREAMATWRLAVEQEKARRMIKGGGESR